LKKKYDVYIRGAYGPGNLGDDVLLSCMISILKNLVDEKQICIGVENLDLAKKFNPNVAFVNFKKPVKSKLLVYGGGGQFFSFKNSKKNDDKNNIFKKTLHFINKNRNPIDALKRLLISINQKAIENLIIADSIASYSIGVGPFEIEGKGTDRFKSFFEKASFISLRDEKSIQLASSFNISEKKIIRAADPSFIAEDWFKETLTDEKILTPIYDYSYIVREWPYSEEGQKLIMTMIDNCREKQKQGFKVRLVSLFSQYDLPLILKTTDLDWLIYDLNKVSMSAFINELINNTTYLISARAHGVWLPTILGHPVLAVGIENKLVQVQKSLPNCSMIVSACDSDVFSNAVSDFENKHDTLKKNINSDIEINRELSLNCKLLFLNWAENELSKN
jgi:polysaccharide pyruvyl transferase WcaK-like protein